MLIIEYVNETICGEPGPNFYWRGSQKDFLEVFSLIQDLVTEKIDHLELSTDNRIKVDGSIRMQVKKNGKILNKKKRNFILMELDITIWAKILTSLESVSSQDGVVYLDFEEYGLYEDANFILESFSP